MTFYSADTWTDRDFAALEIAQSLIDSRNFEDKLAVAYRIVDAVADSEEVAWSTDSYLTDSYLTAP